MKFYNNIFASAYKCYDKYDKSPRYKAASFVFVYMLASFALILALVKKVFFLNFSTLAQYKFLFLIFGLSFLGLLWRYYSSDERVEIIIKAFEKKQVNKRKLWGFITIITFVLQWIAFISLF